MNKRILFNGDKTQYLEFHTDIDLIYLCDSKNNALIQILTMQDVKNFLKEIKENKK